MVPTTEDGPVGAAGPDASTAGYRVTAAAPALPEHAPGTGPLRDTLLRVSRLADDLPQVAGLDLNPVIVRPDGVTAVDAHIRLTSEHLADPFLRRLPQ